MYLCPHELKKIGIILLSLCLFLPLNAKEELTALSSKDLLTMAHKDFDKGTISPNTMLCLNIVAERQEDNTEGKANQVQALMALWNIYFYQFYDYPKCLECLTQSRKILSANNIPIWNMYAGILYQTIGEQGHDHTLCMKALEYYHAGLTQAIQQKNIRIANDLFANLVNLAYSQKRMNIPASLVKKYTLLENGNADPLYTYNISLYEGLTALSARENAKAEKIFHQLALHTPVNKMYVRHHYIAMSYEAEALWAQGKRREAIGLMQTAETLAQRYHIKDMLLEIEQRLADYARAMGGREQQLAYQEKAIALRDSLINYRQLARLGEVKYLSALNEKTQELNRIRQASERQRLITIAAMIVAVLTAFFLFFLLRSYRRIRESNHALYEKNMQLIKNADDKRKESLEKYAGSSLKNEEKERLMQQINHVMNETEHPFSPDFSIEQLATLCQSKYKYVSQVIHEQTGYNFNQYLNSFRIQEACRRMKDQEQYGRYTLEALANSIGFKSRSAFIASFKKNTGLSPSEFLKIVRE